MLCSDTRMRDGSVICPVPGYICKVQNGILNIQFDASDYSIGVPKMGRH